MKQERALFENIVIDDPDQQNGTIVLGNFRGQIAYVEIEIENFDDVDATMTLRQGNENSTTNHKTCQGSNATVTLNPGDGVFSVETQEYNAEYLSLLFTENTVDVGTIKRITVAVKAA